MNSGAGLDEDLVRSRLVAVLRKRQRYPGQIVAASYRELAEELGGGATPEAVHAALVSLERDNFFLGWPHLSSRDFRGRLPG